MYLTKAQFQSKVYNTFTEQYNISGLNRLRSFSPADFEVYVSSELTSLANKNSWNPELIDQELIQFIWDEFHKDVSDSQWEE